MNCCSFFGVLFVMEIFCFITEPSEGSEIDFSKKEQFDEIPQLVERQISLNMEEHKAYKNGETWSQESVLKKFVFKSFGHFKTKINITEPAKSDNDVIVVNSTETKTTISVLPTEHKVIVTTVPPAFKEHTQNKTEPENIKLSLTTEVIVTQEPPSPLDSNIQKPNNPRKKFDNIVAVMDKLIEKSNVNDSDDGICSQKPKKRPNFRKPLQRVSEAKCLEYIWDQKEQISSCKKDRIIALSRIPNGDAAAKGEFPHMGAVGWIANEETAKNFNSDYIFLCGSSLINEFFALTAAHCAHALDNIYVKKEESKPSIVRFGVENIYEKDPSRPAQDSKIGNIIVHPKSDIQHRVNDLALLKFREPVMLGDAVRPACILPQTFASDASVSGWGMTDRYNESPAKELQKTIVNIFSTEKCYEHLTDRESDSEWQGFDEDTQICATNRTKATDACNGDSGGPLQELLANTGLPQYNIIGVVSFYFSCATSKVPSIYTKIANPGYLDWIEGNVWAGEI